MKKFIKKLFCFHPRLKCEEYSSFNFEPDTRITYNSPFALFGTKETRYLCIKCRKKFWYTKGDMEIQKRASRLLELITK
jgi:hypothetical protein